MIFKVRFNGKDEEHVFSFHDFVEGYLCKKCKQNISGPAYKCKDCSLSLHKSCVSRIHPHVIINPSLHGDHPLELGKDGGYPLNGELMHGFVCSKCLYVVEVRSRSYYYCGECDVVFHFFCAASTDQHSKNGNGRQIDKEELKIRHFSHEHILFFGKGWNKWKKEKSNCKWCHRQITGLSYACSNEKGCNFILHESCLKKIPREIKGHPLHPLHPLSIFIPNPGKFKARRKAPARASVIPGRCQACKLILDSSRGFYCRKCNFFLHIRCVNLTAPTLKLNHHEHKLSYFPAEIWRKDVFGCNKCGKTDGLRSRVFSDGAFYIGRSFFYRCVPCDINFHPECISVLPTAKYKYHEHTLFLRDPRLINEPFEEEFYCDICEEERNPNHHAYYCVEEDCEFIAHIECLISDPNEEMALFDKLDVNGLVDEDQNEKDESEEKIPYYCLDGHPLSFSEVFEKDEDVYCNKCRAIICGTPAYTCENCNYYLHKVCAELSYEIQHPYHSKHPLTLSKGKMNFICNRCGDINSEFCYLCQICGVKLDMKCADLVPLKSEHQKVTKKFSIHWHPLTLGKLCRGGIQYFCGGCQQPLLHGGLAYCCFEWQCKLFLHESCASSLPREIRHQQNSYLLRDHVAMDDYCSACQFRTGPLAYIGNLGNFHYICCTSLARALKREFHEHELYYFGVDHQRFYKSLGDEIKCTRCKKKCDGPFYSCLECEEFKLHLDCVPIPRVVKGKCHRHPLTLKDSFVEGGYDENDYYCDVCEEKRNTEHHVYVCEECPSECPFVAHIECMLSSKNYLEIKELGHVHPLSRTEVTKGENLYCNKCTRKISGPAYTCVNCNIYLHKLCAQLPNEIQHPCHSQHPLTLRITHSLKGITCNACRRFSVFNLFYKCQQCGMVFDTNCVALEEGVIPKSPVQTDENFGHEHPLIFIGAIKKKERSYDSCCHKCFAEIFGPSYRCKNCRFQIHKLCAEMPEKIQHPFHSQHPLTLFTSPIYKDIICDGCGYLSLCHHFYHCQYCGTILDMNCAALKKEAVAELSKKTHENFGHKHPLSFIEETYKYHRCHKCYDKIYGPAYRCQDCGFWLHKVCAELLDTIQHPFHSQHPLTLVRIRRHWPQVTSICDQCGDESMDAIYYCQHCCIKLDMKCANSEKGVAAKRSKKVIHSNAALIFLSRDYSKYKMIVSSDDSDSEDEF